eukprot:9474917-Pyramimonas_sp.AAC.2
MGYVLGKWGARATLCVRFYLGFRTGVTRVDRLAQNALSPQVQFREWVDGLLNVSVPIILSKRALRSKEVRDCE